MIPIAVFVILWLVFLAIFMVISLLSVMQMMRFGVQGPETKWAVVLFVGLAVSIIAGTLLYLSQINMHSELNIKPILESVFPY